MNMNRFVSCANGLIGHGFALGKNHVAIPKNGACINKVAGCDNDEPEAA
jgi:hypothetical protein